MSASSFLRRLIGRLRPGLDRRTQHLATLCEALLGERGEVSGAALAREALAAYQSLDDRGRHEFFHVLAEDFSPSPEAVGRAADAYRNDATPENLIRLQAIVDSARQELFRRLNMAPGGTETLVAMRGELLRGLKANPSWRAIDADLLHLFRSWFNRGFLRLDRIDWRTSALVLEKLIQYEAVHAVQGWRDLRRRLEGDRRCFAFFHPQLRDEPLIFIEVALTRGLSAQVQPLLDINAPVAAPAQADCAIFYSITNCQEGLRGTSFGNLLIKQVAEELKREFPSLRTFATLSPIPGFLRWLERTDTRVGLSIGPNAEQRLALLSAIETTGWHTGAIQEPLQKLLMRLCAWYLLNAKQGAEPLDPVARFHLGNGAALERVNWLGDTSQSGMARSAGMMVNYVYRLEDVERNHERYFADHAVVASRAVEKLARKSPLSASGAHVGKPAEA
ncbi:MAG: malonyl-CoA decarboxylase [Candidatus Parcubacteria bacterium]|nr:malonyl-CoA decarboxylase [Burkholderiales bacterium]